MSKDITRRAFLKKSGRSATLGGVLLTGAASARSEQAAPGANERIRIGMIGCGGRNRMIVRQELPAAAKKYNAQVVACCDIWRQNREKGIALVNKKYGVDPKPYQDYHKLLDDKEIDTVIIATPDHQHCQMLIDAVQAGKDVYIEKPIAMNMEELNAAYDAVRASQCIVQHGTQGRSSHGAESARDFVQSGKLGKLLRAEESRSSYTPYWNHQPNGPKNESDTNWKAFLFNRPYRPYDPDQHGHWMGYRDFSTGTAGGWMSHFSDFLHYLTGCGVPLSGAAHGGIYAHTSKKGRTCPDTFTGILEYAEGFTTSYTTHFGNQANNYQILFGTKGIMRIGTPEGGGTLTIPCEVSGEGSEDADKIAGTTKLELSQSEGHVANWLRCIRERKQPNANMEAGYKHGVAVLLVDRAFVEGTKMVFDPKRREIHPA